jgi:hypothetical protein
MDRMERRKGRERIERIGHVATAGISAATGFFFGFAFLFGFVGHGIFLLLKIVKISTVPRVLFDWGLLFQSRPIS